MRKTAQAIVLTAIGLFAASDLHAREGFGFTKKAATMNRLKPPVTTLGARRVKITAKAERTENSDDATTLRRLVEEAVLSGAGTVAGEKDKGDVQIKITLDRLNSHESTGTKTKSVYQKVGSHQEWDAKNKKYVTKDDYANVNQSVQVRTLSGSLTGTFDVLDKAGKVVESGDLSERYEQTFDEGTTPPSPSKVEDDLLKKAATKVASQLVPTQDRVSVILPKGSFESLIPFAEMNAWDRYLAGVEAVPPKRDARQEAYRQYALAVAKEGLAYSSVDDRERILQLLREAITHYETAIRSHPGEKIFSTPYESLLSYRTEAPMPRASGSLASFEKWIGTGSAPSRRPAVARAEPSRSEPQEAATLTNVAIIEMAKAGLTDENLMLAIDAAVSTQFDTTPNGLIALARGGVSRNVIAHMQKKAKRYKSNHGDREIARRFLREASVSPCLHDSVVASSSKVTGS